MSEQDEVKWYQAYRAGYRNGLRGKHNGEQCCCVFKDDKLLVMCLLHSNIVKAALEGKEPKRSEYPVVPNNPWVIKIACQPFF